MKFGSLEINPSASPGVLDTATWDLESARRAIVAAKESLLAAHESAASFVQTETVGRKWPSVSSLVRQGQNVFFLAELDDGQKVFIRRGSGHGRELGEPFLTLPTDDGRNLSAYATGAPAIGKFCRQLAPANAPKALGRAPRLGIGTRMTTRVWPGIFAAMDRKQFAANTIQNSVRELNLLDDLKSGQEPVRNYASGFGMIESGYTGSTFEGLWVAGVLAALQHAKPLVYGADADHIQIKRADAELANAKRLIEAARYYTFFTLDIADILNFESLAQKGKGASILEQTVESDKERRDIISYHAQPLRIGGAEHRLDEDLVGRCIGKYWQSLKAVSALCQSISAVREGAPFDVEFAFDEHPPEIPGPSCISEEGEVIFVARELARSGLPVTHIAPNFGVEKGFDYRLEDGYTGLRTRVERIQRIAEETGYLLDFHSADDLSRDARRAIRGATAGKLHYKISPMLQFIFTEVVRDFHLDIFLQWWNDAFAYARTEAERGSPLATACLKEYGSLEKPSPAPSHEVFRQFFFAFPGRRDPSGRFIHREMMYTLSEACYQEYARRVEAHLCELADDLLE